MEPVKRHCKTIHKIPWCPASCAFRRTKMLAGFKSRCITWAQCRWSKPSKTCTWSQITLQNCTFNLQITSFYKFLMMCSMDFLDEDVFLMVSALCLGAKVPTLRVLQCHATSSHQPIQIAVHEPRRPAAIHVLFKNSCSILFLLCFRMLTGLFYDICMILRINYIILQ